MGLYLLARLELFLASSTLPAELYVNHKLKLPVNIFNSTHQFRDHNTTLVIEWKLSLTTDKVGIINECVWIKKIDGFMLEMPCGLTYQKTFSFYFRIILVECLSIITLT